MSNLKKRTRHDTAYPLIMTLRDKNGARNLTGCTVTFTMVNRETDEIKINRRTCTVLDQLTNLGQVQFDWQAADVNKSGIYFCQFEVVFADTSKASWPNKGPMILQIVDDVDNF